MKTNIAVVPYALALTLAAASLALPIGTSAETIRPGQVWRDTEGEHIQAHSAGILFHDGVYYWYGENKSAPNDSADAQGRILDRVPVIGVSAYSSHDLVHWKNEGLVLKAVPDDPAHDLHPSKVCERPKVLFNARTKQFVMWWHMDTADYLAARAGVAVADHPTGPFRYLRSFRPINDQRYRDMNLLLDDDGQAYVFYASEDNATLYISRLNADFTDIQRPAVEGKTWRRNFPGASREAPAPFKHAGRYYLITSGCTGWNPNPADLAAADHPLGPYVSQGNPCVGPGADKTFGAQSTFVLPLPNQPGHFVFLADRWNPKNLRDSRYAWLPFDIVPDQPVRIEWRDSWQPRVALDVPVPKTDSTRTPPAPSAALHQPAEDDWWLPDWVQPVQNSGVHGADQAPPGFVDVEGLVLPWRMIEPEEGVYDWSLLTKALARGRPMWLRFFASDVSHCPEWLQRKHADLKHHRFRWPDGGYDDISGYLTGKTTIRSAGEFFEIWDPRFEAEFRRLLQEFARQGFGRDPRIRFAYFPHAFRWNEYSLKWVPEMARAGFSPENYVAWFKRTLDDYVAAFGNDAGRIVYTGTGNREWIESAGDAAIFNRWDRAINTPDGGNVLSQHSLKSGGGVRDGFTEAFNHFAWRPDWGLNLVTEGGFRYSVISEQHPLIRADRRFFGTENEDFDYLWPDVKHYHWLKLSTLNMLRLRMNWVFLGNYRVAPDLLQYMRRTMGRKVHESPDAWVALRQYGDSYLVNDQRGDGAENLRNFERWLFQRDLAPDGLTTATQRIEPPAKFAALNGGSWEALRTDQARGSHRIYFNVDDHFLNGGPARVLVKITYLDNREGDWWIEYDAGADAAWKKSPPVQHAHDGRWKTATVELPDAAFENRQRGWADFCLTKGGTEDLAVRFVRLIKTGPPNPAPAK